MITVPLNKFKIYLKKVSTGESSEIVIQAPFSLIYAKSIADHLIDTDKFDITNIELVPSVVKIKIEPLCLN